MKKGRSSPPAARGTRLANFLLWTTAHRLRNWRDCRGFSGAECAWRFIRSLSGEQIVLSNKDLLESRVLNFERLQRRRCVHKISVAQNTEADSLERIPLWIGDIVKRYDLLQHEACTLIDFGASSMDFELVFFVASADYNVFINYQQKVLLDILRKFKDEEVRLALP